MIDQLYEVNDDYEQMRYAVTETSAFNVTRIAEYKQIYANEVLIVCWELCRMIGDEGKKLWLKYIGEGRLDAKKKCMVSDADKIRIVRAVVRTDASTAPQKFSY